VSVTALRLCLLAAVLLLGGCVSRDFSMRTLPPDTPAADNAAAVKQLQVMQAEAAAAAQRAAASGAANVLPPLTAADVPSLTTYDPWERLNRFTYRFNARFDDFIFLPAADTYRRLPGVVRSGVHNFFSNLTEVVTTLNYAAQLRPAPAVRSIGRFAINSTMGIGGLFDVATAAHIPGVRTGFAQTMSRWGVGPGPYLVAPLLGPSNVRDTSGFVIDYGVNYGINILDLYRGLSGWVLTPLAMVDLRANTSFRYYSTGSPFEYDAVRFLVVRKTLIEDDAQRIWHTARRDPQRPAGP
jgi:phospholipid-binding lipoprotein MlaA